MALQEATKTFMRYLHDNPAIRARIRAHPDKTLLYAGSFFMPIWKEIALAKLSQPQLADKQTLPDILMTVSTPGTGYANLLARVQDLERQVPWQSDGFIAWRALSGIFAANAIGKVSFQIGSGITRDKVFAATELAVLMRNPKVDALTKDVLAYYQRCIQGKNAALNFGYIAG